MLCYVGNVNSLSLESMPRSSTNWSKTTNTKVENIVFNSEQISTRKWIFMTSWRSVFAIKKIGIPPPPSDVPWILKGLCQLESMRARVCKLLSTVTILLFLTHDFRCHVQGSKIYRRLQSNLVWIRGTPRLMFRAFAIYNICVQAV